MRQARIKISARHFKRALLTIVILMVAKKNAVGQGVDLGFISRSSPAPAFINPEPARYNIKIGRMNARFRPSLQTEFIDNINLSENNPEGDVAFNPNLKVGFVYELTDIQLLEFNVGVGYRWYLDHPSVGAFNVDPRSSIDYKVTIGGDVEVRFYDSFGMEVDPYSRVDVAGQDPNVLDFRRFNNTAGTLVSWQPNSEFRMSGGYSYGISRSLTEEYKVLDLDSHTFSAATYYTLSPRVTTGLYGSYSFLRYAENTQNNGTSLNVGPVLVYRPTQFISATAFIGYSVVQQEASSIAPAGTLDGVAANLTIEHRLNRYLSHDLRLSQGRFLGINGIFNETFVAQYGILARLNSKVNVRATAMLETLTGEGRFSEDATRQLFYIGTGYQLTRKWSWNAGYTFSLRESDRAGRGYTQNRFTIDINREF